MLTLIIFEVCSCEESRKSPKKPQPNPKCLAILGDKNNKSPVAVKEKLLQKS